MIVTLDLMYYWGGPHLSYSTCPLSIHRLVECSALWASRSETTWVCVHAQSSVSRFSLKERLLALYPGLWTDNCCDYSVTLKSSRSLVRRLRRLPINGIRCCSHQVYCIGYGVVYLRISICVSKWCTWIADLCL